MVLSPLARQVVALGLALAAVALALAYPVRGYLQQQQAERRAVAEQHELEGHVEDLQADLAALKDPNYVREEAKRRLQYVTPGDTVYVVKVPDGDASASNGGDAISDDARAAEKAAEESIDGDGPGTSGGAGSDNSPSGSTGSTGSAADGPDGTVGGDAVANEGEQPWYTSLWDTLAGDDDTE